MKPDGGWAMQVEGEAILVIDAGTTSNRAMVFAPDGTVRAMAQRALTQHYPRAGWVEHDAEEIWQGVLACARQAVTQAGGVDRIAAIGIANQRETVVAWDKASGAPLTRAIVWQDRRTASVCEALREAGHEAGVQAATGLILDPYFSATKMGWMHDAVPEVRAASESGRLALGTVESWLLYRLTGGAHMTDASNASRTSLLGLAGRGWDEGLCDLFGVPRAALPEICDCAGAIGTALPEWLGASVAVAGMAGDQQAATIGQGCLAVGETKATYGTGAFVLANMGAQVPSSAHRLLATVLCQTGGERTYALEGSVFVAGSLVQWLRDSLGLIDAASETEALARSVQDSGGVVIVPALAGLGAPHWRADARASISGLTFASTRAHLVRAALEAMAMQTRDLAEAFAADGATWTTLRIDGGMSANDWIAQDLADVLALPVERPASVETTALGAAMLAGLGAGLFASLEAAAAAMGGTRRTFTPSMSEAVRGERIENWARALAAV
ncbi:glycerol kinase GlpK [Novosphingobium mangrovi (ex Huang et al. 2023)]|uniref:Glycerol kinase GlpK n=1 Tax=Novosphingobium mangrovi (ex Huang et al. 2023) TaxID=2976432 RepID=A0ABT2HZF9_9SPHN|nr:glycerol kinase GlpK [Novosphingobium mangrovi (ex Huang et al. 2023)]MCT2397937.1 glycerol kinase GlpK [Novosphingobium mangrovi (ex Huang et al. 2023)]